MKHIFLLIFSILLFSAVFSEAYSIEDHLNEWKDNIVGQKNFFSEGENPNIFVYYFDQSFESLANAEAGTYVADVIEEFKDDFIMDEGTQIASAVRTGAAFKAGELSFNINQARFISKLSSTSIPIADFTVINDALDFISKSTSSGAHAILTPEMTMVFNNYNLAYDAANDTITFTDKLGSGKVIASQIKFGKDGKKTLSQVLPALRKAASLDEYKNSMFAYNKLIELRDGVKSVDALKGTQRTAKITELSAELKKLREAGTLSDDVLKAAGFTDSSGNLVGVLDDVAKTSTKRGVAAAAKTAAVTDTVAKLNLATVKAKPSVVSRLWSGVTGSKVGKFTSKAFKIGGTFLGIPKAIVNTGFEGLIAFSLPEVASPDLRVDKYTSKGDDVGVSVLIDPQFSLNVQRYKSARERFEKSIDQSLWQNAIWETASFFDVTELGWSAAEYLVPALNSAQSEFIVSESGCSIGIISTASKDVMDEFINAQKNSFKCLITDSSKAATVQLFLPKGKHVVLLNSRMTEKMIDKVVSDKTSIIGVPLSFLGKDAAARTFAERQYVQTNGFPAKYPAKVIVENPIALGSSKTDNLELVIRLESGKTILDYLKSNSNVDDLTADSINSYVKLYRIASGGDVLMSLDKVNIVDNNVTLSFKKGVFSSDASYKLLFDVPMKPNAKKISFRISGLRKVS